ncbi:MAG TPA: hypothetical protein PLS50_07015, partial [Candidatus Dojkabacteria bacterium]|nr:hypothetical protein [Candidatus Dojkabacteria bacterium]
MEPEISILANAPLNTDLTMNERAFAYVRHGKSLIASSVEPQAIRKNEEIVVEVDKQTLTGALLIASGKMAF